MSRHVAKFKLVVQDIPELEAKILKQMIQMKPPDSAEFHYDLIPYLHGEDGQVIEWQASVSIYMDVPDDEDDC